MWWSGCGLRVIMAWCVCHGEMWCVSVTCVAVCNWSWWENLNPEWYGYGGHRMLCPKLFLSVSFQNPIFSRLGEKQQSVSTAGQ